MSAYFTRAGNPVAPEEVVLVSGKPHHRITPACERCGGSGRDPARESACGRCRGTGTGAPRTEPVYDRAGLDDLIARAAAAQDRRR